MQINEFHLVNVFTSEKAQGNQCAVVMLDDLSDGVKLQKLAADFNLPATTFLKKKSEGIYDIRWFAPMAEIPLCGHGSMGAAHALNHRIEPKQNLVFQYHGGVLEVGRKSPSFLCLKSEVIDSEFISIPPLLQEAFHGKVREYRISSGKHLVIFESSEEVKKMKPDWEKLKETGVFAFAITAKDDEFDFISRTLLPQLPFLEDHATGSSHFGLAPYWSKVLGKHNLHAFQASERGGEMYCEVTDGYVVLSANCQSFGKGLLCD